MLGDTAIFVESADRQSSHKILLFNNAPKSRQATAKISSPGQVQAHTTWPRTLGFGIDTCTNRCTQSRLSGRRLKQSSLFLEQCIGHFHLRLNYPKPPEQGDALPLLHYLCDIDSSPAIGRSASDQIFRRSQPPPRTCIVLFLITSFTP